MSLNGAMLSSTSGMTAQSNWLSSIGDNISNSNTTGYKESPAHPRRYWQTRAVYVPSGGVSTVMRYGVAQQGLVQSTTSTTDLAISGKGFFVVNDAGRVRSI